ncbi:MAG TPA: hypothetical protein GXX29_00630 [Firmicutes bacterium]|nr:hypothetical protein [Bacillota bacterium]
MSSITSGRQVGEVQGAEKKRQNCSEERGDAGLAGESVGKREGERERGGSG